MSADMRVVMMTGGDGRCLFNGRVAYDLTEEEMNAIRIVFMQTREQAEAVSMLISTREEDSE